MLIRLLNFSLLAIKAFDGLRGKALQNLEKVLKIHSYVIRVGNLTLSRPRNGDIFKTSTTNRQFYNGHYIWRKLTCLQLDLSYLIGQTAAPAPLISNV